MIAEIAGKNDDEVKQLILVSIKSNRAKILKKNQFFEFLFDGLSAEHLTPERLSKLDASEILDTLLQHLGLNFTDFLEAYTKKCFELGRRAEVFPTQITSILENAVASVATDEEANSEGGAQLETR